MQLLTFAKKNAWFAAALILLFLYTHLRISQNAQLLQDNGDLKEITRESLQSIQDAREKALRELQSEIDSKLLVRAKVISDEQALALEKRLKNLRKEHSKVVTELKAAKSKRDRILNGKPEQVELDDLQN